MDEMIGDIHAEFLNALLKGDRSVCSELVFAQLRDGVTFKELYENILKPALYSVGELWEYNKISVATEHLASAIVESILNQLYPQVVSKERIEKKIIISCVEKEYHQIGIKMVGDIFESNGWNSFFLGANTPTAELISFAKIIKPDMFAVSLSVYFHLSTLEIMIKKIENTFPDTPILIGGQAFTRGAQDFLAKYTNVIFLRDLYSIDSYIKNLD